MFALQKSTKLMLFSTKTWKTSSFGRQIAMFFNAEKSISF
jgi:hypothetical protein